MLKDKLNHLFHRIELPHGPLLGMCVRVGGSDIKVQIGLEKLLS